MTESETNQKNQAKLSPAKKALLEKMLRGEIKTKTIPQHQSNAIPLSFAQERLWFLEQLAPNKPLYNEPTAIHLQGKLNINALQYSLNQIVQRHESLRTTFTTINGQPIQIIAPILNLNLRIINLQSLTANQQEIEVQSLAVAEAAQPFDLVTGPLIRVTLLQLSETEHVLLLTMHHIICDRWSFAVLMQELATLYQNRSLPKLPIQYADFAVWQRHWLTGDVLTTQLSYWKQQLAGSPTLLKLPTDRPRPAVISDRASQLSFTLPQPLTQALKALAQQEQATLFMTLLTAFKILLYCYTQQQDILVGTTIAGRNREELEGLIGFFVNTLVLRTNLGGKPSFRELLRRVRASANGAYVHQDLPFEQIVELQPQRNLSHTPLFQVMFQLQNTPTYTLELPNLTWKTLDFPSQTAKFDLSLSMVESDRGLVGNFEYNTDLFDDATISRMQGHFQTLLQGIIANPDQVISKLPLLTNTEQYQLLQKYNDTQAPYPQALCHQLFEAQVTQTPNAIAVVYQDAQLTYQQLNQRANQLAHYLHTLGVAPEVLVGICVDRSLEMVVAILAILKAGGAYLPLDPAYPTERLNWMLTDAKVALLITQKNLLSLLPNQAKTICLDTNSELIAQQSDFNPVAPKVTAENLAYVIYTSGSTGKPKGVMIQQNNLVNAYWCWEKAYQLRATVTSHLQMASFAFDVFSGDLVRALCSGGKLILCPKELLLSPQELYQLMLQQKVDCADFVPAVLRNLMQYLKHSQQQLELMRILVCGSDSWYASEYQEFLECCHPQTRLINAFGVTETTIDSCYFDTKIDLSDKQLVPIGKPFANIQLYILDAHLQAVPIGIPGELYISGAGLARGYLGRPELTAEKFIPNPYQQDLNLGDRLYKTGDLVRYLADGNIEFIGRIDNQVKLRGFRIEIGEIETILAHHPNVREVVVLVREITSTNKYLVAYIVPGNAISITELGDFLKQKLPAYMIPDAFVSLAALPLTPNGKIDRNALPPVDLSQQKLEITFKPPRTPVEEILTDIWRQILNVSKISIEDNFFELGGHSLLATQLIAQIRQVFKIELPLRCLFESPTIAGIATNIQFLIQQGKNLQIPSILPTSRNQEIPLSFAQARLWFLDQLQSGNAYNIFDAIRLSGFLNQAALAQSINEIIRRHEILRTRFIAVDGRPIQVIEPNLEITLPLIDLQTLPRVEQEAEIQQLITKAVKQPFNLNQSPLLRISLLKLNSSEHIILFTMHHIIFDAWSMGVLVREVAKLYPAFVNNETLPLPELPIQYADFAIWQRQWLTSETLQTQLSYWKQQLRNLPAIKLPTDYPRPVNSTHQGAKQSLLLSKTLSQQLKTFSTQAGTTLFITLLAAFKTLLHYYSNQTDIVVGTDIANRNRTETERLIGFFVNQLVLRTTITESTFAEYLQTVHQVTIDAIAHQDLPFDVLVNILNPQRTLNTSPLFQVKLILDNTPTQALELPNLTITPIAIAKTTTQLDLILRVTETPQGMITALEYNTDIFNTSTIIKILDHLKTLLNQIITQPNLKIQELLNILATADKHQQKQQLQQKLKTTRRKPTTPT